MIKIRVQKLEIPLKHSFKHASAERQHSASLWVVAERNGFEGLGEGCPRSYVTGESLDGALEWAQARTQELSSFSQFGLSELKNFVETHKAEIDKNPASWCAIELALLDLFAKEKGLSLERLLGVSEDKKAFHYSAVLSADNPGAFASKLKKYQRYAFVDYKLKVVASAKEDLPRLEQIAARFTKAPLWSRAASSLLKKSGYLPSSEYRLRVDANNAGARNASGLEEVLDKSPFPIWAIEEPFAARDFERMAELSQRRDMAIILDESLGRLSDIDLAAKHKARWIGNMRISKVGGLLRSLQMLSKIKDLGWGLIIGAQVGESSVLTRAAQVLAQAAGSELLAQEGAFGTKLMSVDAASPSLEFGLAGRMSRVSGVGNALRENTSAFGDE